MKGFTLQELPPPPPGKSGWPWTEAPSILRTDSGDGSNWPRISIVTPSYNQGRYLEATIRSVLLQGYPDLEYIIIDGGSSDESVEILRKYEKQISYWVSEKDAGHANGLNKGFARTTGEIMAWINSDDLYAPHALWVAAEVMTSFSDVQWLTAAFQSDCGVDETISSIFTPGFSRRFFEAGGYMGFLYSTAWIQQESTFWTRSLWEIAGGALNEEISLAVDFELWNRFFRYSDLATVEARLGCFRKHDQQRSRSHASVYRREAMNIIRLGSPWALSALIGAYRAVGLGKLLHWRHLLKLLYGQRCPVIARDVNQAWTKKTLWIA